MVHGRTRLVGLLPLALERHQHANGVAARICVGLHAGHASRARSDSDRSGRRDVRIRQFRPRLCARCGDRKGALGIRPADRRPVGPICLLRRREPRHRRLEGPRLRGRLGRIPARHRCRHRPTAVEGRYAAGAGPAHAVHHHRRAPGGGKSRRHRRRRRGFSRRARLRRRVRSRHRPHAMALLHGASRSRAGRSGSAAPDAGGQDLGPASPLGHRCRRRRVGRDCL